MNKINTNMHTNITELQSLKIVLLLPSRIRLNGLNLFAVPQKLLC